MLSPDERELLKELEAVLKTASTILEEPCPDFCFEVKVLLKKVRTRLKRVDSPVLAWMYLRPCKNPAPSRIRVTEEAVTLNFEEAKDGYPIPLIRQPR